MPENGSSTSFVLNQQTMSDTMSEQLSIKNYLLQGGTWAFLGKTLTAIMGLTLSALLARLLSPEEMGGYFLALNVATLCSIFGTCGLENTMVRFVSEAMGMDDPGGASTIIRKGFTIVMISVLLLALIIFFGFGQYLAKYVFQSQVLSTVIGFVAVWLVLLSFQVLFGASFRAFYNIRSSVLYGGLLTAILTVFLLSIYRLFFTTASLKQLLSLVLAAGLINLLLAMMGLRKYQKALGRAANKEVSYVGLFEHSWPLLLNGLTGYVTMQSGIWILAAFQPDEEIALYGAATRLVLLVGMALAIVNAVLPPLIARLNVQGEKQKLEQILRTMSTLAVFPSFIVLAVFMFYGEAVLDLVFGTYYRSAAHILAIISMGQATNVFVGSCGFTLIMTGHRKAMMIISIVSSTVMIICSLLMVQGYAAIGVALGMTIGIMLQQFLMLIYCHRLCGVWTHAGVNYVFKIFQIGNLKLW